MLDCLSLSCSLGLSSLRLTEAQQLLKHTQGVWSSALLLGSVLDPSLHEGLEQGQRKASELGKGLRRELGSCG